MTPPPGQLEPAARRSNICVCVELPTVSSAYIVCESRLGVGDSARAVAIATDELNSKSAFFGLWPPKSVRTRDRGVMVKARYLSLRSGSAGHRVSWRVHTERAATSAARAEPSVRLCNGYKPRSAQSPVDSPKTRALKGHVPFTEIAFGGHRITVTVALVYLPLSPAHQQPTARTWAFC